MARGRRTAQFPQQGPTAAAGLDQCNGLLNGHTTPVAGPGWPKSRSYPVRECLLCILNEEWEHRLYAERDLEALAARTS